MDNKIVFANNLNKQMELKGVSRQDICNALGVSYFTITDWVKGKKYPRMDKVEKLAEYFGVPKSELIEERKVVYIKDKVNKTIAVNIQSFRERANMSPKELAVSLGVSDNVVLDIESGKLTPKKDMIFRICDVFHTTPAFLDGSISDLEENGDLDAEYRYKNREKNTPSKLELTEGEKMLLELFKQIPKEQQEVFLEMGRVYANSLKKD